MRNRVLIAFIFLLALAGCVKKQSAQNAPVKTYTLTGVIKALDAEHKIATIEHQEIVGWMGAMTMEFPIRGASDFAQLQVGQKITAKVNVQDLEYWLSEIQTQ